MNLQLVTEQMSRAKLALCACLIIASLTGCSEKRPTATLQQRYESARALFEKASRDYHIPSAEARGDDRRKLEEQAAMLYANIAKSYADQSHWASQALRSLANIRAAQTNVTEAVTLYAQVAERFPKQDFEALMSWKSAADLLSDSDRQTEAKIFYEKIIGRFDQPDTSAIVQSVVRGSKARLKGETTSFQESRVSEASAPRGRMKSCP